MSASELNEFLTAMDMVRDVNAAALNHGSALPFDETMLDNESDWYHMPVEETVN
ncbi:MULTISPECIES: hypothetical protein [Bradyrhizobium]|uniref:Uncharacterized protein n=1 Tax=Bradyrhizobium aeschynomenes TaxID=2734909 RepID=A0ABX2CJI8_9BRAD|nr:MULTISPECIES: hypothetical protein [Bradyrhizobium]NPU12347.1 hypothetical protein [Bradyrhizobium aeschynomenes]NPU67580.1 hypothetical protein [Bradyrhizobium aeschynomenes]NPV22905.1 hypothetical protein [Bradyrhizobium aeschynomenes]